MSSTQSGSRSSLPRTDPTVDDDTRLLPNQPGSQHARPKKHGRPSSRSSSEFSTTSNSHTWIMPRLAFSDGNINRLLPDNGSDNPTVQSDPTSNPRHRRRDLNQRLKEYRKERRQRDKISALLHGSPLNPFPSDRVSLNSAGTSNFTSVSGKETQAVYQPNLLDTVHAWGMTHGIIAERQHQLQQMKHFQELNSQLAKELQECWHTHTCEISLRIADHSAPQDPQNSAAQEMGESDEEEDDSQEEDVEVEYEDAELVDDEDDYEEKEDTSTLRNTTDGSTETFDSEDEPKPEEEAHLIKYLERLEELKKNAREPLPWQIVKTSASNTESDGSSGLQ